MCNIRIHIHSKSGCNLIKLILTYCACCPYVSKRPIPSCFNVSKSPTTSDYQVYWFNHYLDLAKHKKHKIWKSRLAKCPNWTGAKYIEMSTGECPAGSACQRDKDRRVRLIFDNGRGRGERKRRGNLTRGPREIEIEVEDLMEEMARLEAGFDVEGERKKELFLQRDQGLKRMRMDEDEIERVRDGVLQVLAMLEKTSRERGDERKTWWKQEVGDEI